MDGGIAKTANKGGYATVCRTTNGEYNSASTVAIEGLTNPGILEALACCEALSLAQDINARRIVIACDCLPVVQNIRRGSRGAYSAVLKEIFVLMKLFDEVRVVHESRKSNADAHNVSKFVLSLPVDRHVWLLNPPDPGLVP